MLLVYVFFFFKQKTAYEMRISDWSSDVCSSDLSFTVDRALELAGVVSPSLEAATADIRAAEAGRRVAGLRPNPSVMVEAENVAGSGPYRGPQSLEATTSLTLQIELGGKRTARIADTHARDDRTPEEPTTYLQSQISSTAV